MRKIEIFHIFYPPVSHGGKCGKFQFLVEIAHKAVLLQVHALSKLLKFTYWQVLKMLLAHFGGRSKDMCHEPPTMLHHGIIFQKISMPAS